jgi:type IV pilus assembly protein PilF
MITSNKIACAGWVLASLTIGLTVGMAGCANSKNVRESKKKEPSATETARMYIEIANGALLEGDATGALENLFRAEKIDSKLPELYHSEALAYYMKHDLPIAVEKARKAVELKPDYSDAENTLGKLLIDSGRTDEAIQYLVRASNDPVYHEAFKALTNLGIVYYRRDDYARADRYLTLAIEDAAASACVAFYYRGQIRVHDSRFREALSDYDNAGKKGCAGFADAHLAMGLVYERSRQYDLARKKYLEIESRFPNSKFADQAMNHLRSLP